MLHLADKCCVQVALCEISTSKYLVVFMTVVHTYFHIVVDTQRGCRTTKFHLFVAHDPQKNSDCFHNSIKNPQFLIYAHVTFVKWQFNFFKCQQDEIMASERLRIVVIYSFFWDVKQPRLIVIYRHFGTTYRSQLQGLDPRRRDRYFVPKW